MHCVTHCPSCTASQVIKAASDTLSLLLDSAPALQAIELLVPHLPPTPPPPSSSSSSSHSAALPGDGESGGNGDVLGLTLRSLHDALRRTPAWELSASPSGGEEGDGSSGPLHRLMPGLVCAFIHTRAEVRKGTVLCLVEVRCKLQGEAEGLLLLAPYLAALTEAQRKLVDIYCQRVQQQ